jgi:RNA polymerase sigma-70 factor, ECF subfamily
MSAPSLSPETMNTTAQDAQAHSTAEAAARNSRARLLAFLAARSGDVAAAEDALSDAFAAALESWPKQGCPQNPDAWLLTVARRKLIDAARRRQADDGPDELDNLAASLDEAASGEIPDRRLGLLFACAHPAIDPAIRAPLMLQVVLGLEAARIASAFLMSPAAMGQRLVRAKTKIRQAGIPFHIPDREQLADRLEAVLDAIYAAFSEGWQDPAGADVARRDLADEAIYLCRIVTELLPDEPEVFGLLALMLYAEARRAARRNAQGEYVPLKDQDTRLWDSQFIEHAESALHRASRAGRIGRYQLEAAIQSAHVERHRTGATNWPAILHLYDGLFALTGSPVAALNRALALAEVAGSTAALSVLEDLAADPRLSDYQPYWAARAELLARTGQVDAASHAYERSIGLERDPAVRQFLDHRRAALTTVIPLG